MMKSKLLLLSLVGAAEAFVGNSPVFHSTPRRTQLCMGGAGGEASTLAGKVKTVERVSELLDKSQMVFSVPVDGITVAQTQTLRQSMPEGTVVACVKNKLMKRAIDGTEYEIVGELLKGSNYWFFIEEDIGGTVKAFNSFSKEFDKKESNPILGGAMEGIVYDTKGVDAVSKLPSKLELIAKIAGGIKAVPQKVAAVVKAPNSKLARAIKLATMPEEE